MGPLVNGYMRVHIENAPWSDEVLVYVVGGGDQPRIWRPACGQDPARWEPYEEGSQPEPSFRLRADIWRAIAAAAEPSTAPELAADAIKDARATRDRLLTMIEAKYR